VGESSVAEASESEGREREVGGGQAAGGDGDGAGSGEVRLIYCPLHIASGTLTSVDTIIPCISLIAQSPTVLSSSHRFFGACPGKTCKFLKRSGVPETWGMTTPYVPMSGARLGRR
jgi:hypothetical protein